MDHEEDGIFELAGYSSQFSTVEHKCQRAATETLVPPSKLCVGSAAWPGEKVLPHFPWH